MGVRRHRFGVSAVAVAVAVASAGCGSATVRVTNQSTSHSSVKAKSDATIKHLNLSKISARVKEARYLQVRSTVRIESGQVDRSAADVAPFAQTVVIDQQTKNQIVHFDEPGAKDGSFTEMRTIGADMYLKAPDDKTWLKFSEAGTGALLDSASGLKHPLALLDANGLNMQSAGTVTVDGDQLTRYRGNLDSAGLLDRFAEAASGYGAPGGAADESVDKADYAGSIEVLVDATGFLRRMSFTLTTTIGKDVNVFTMVTDFKALDTHAPIVAPDPADVIDGTSAAGIAKLTPSGSDAHAQQKFDDVANAIESAS